MKISKKYKDSYLSSMISFLFAPKDIGLFEDTFLGRIFSFSINWLGELLVVISFLLLLYKGILPPQLSSLAPISTVLALLFIDKRKVKISKALIWLIIFFTFVTLSALVAVLSGLSFGMISMGWLLWLQFMIFLILGMSLRSDRIYKIIPILVFPVSGYGIYQYFFSNITTTLWVSELESIPLRAFSLVGDPNVYGMISAVALIASLIIFLKGRKLYALGVLTFGVAIILSFSRTTWLSLLVALIVFVLLKNRKYLLFAPLALLVLLVGKVRERILVIFNPAFLNSSSMDGRIWIANNVIYIWKRAPLLGFGPGSYGGMIAREYASPVYHLGLQNGYVALYFTDGQWLQTLIQTGILGLMSLAGFFAASIYSLVSSWRKKQELYILGGLMFTVFLITSCFTSNIIEFSLVIMPISLFIGSALNEA